jgi:hypothetical protein
MLFTTFNTQSSQLPSTRHPFGILMYNSALLGAWGKAWTKSKFFTCQDLIAATYSIDQIDIH